MGTRGLYGIRKGQKDKLTYNHFDSYPSGLGKDVLRFLHDGLHGLYDLDAFFDKIKLVDISSVPDEQAIDWSIKHGFYVSNVSNQSTQDWYCLLRGLQGNFEAYEKLASTDDVIYMSDDSDFIKASLFCEYAYIINLDENVLEFWEGYQHEAQEGNRYGNEPDKKGYYPCALRLKIPFDRVRNASAAEIQNIVDEMH